MGKVIFYGLSSYGLGLLVVLLTFAPGVLLSVFIALPVSRPMSAVLSQGGLAGLVLYLVALWVLQERYIESLPRFARALLFTAAPALLSVTFGKAAYFETGLALAFFATVPLYQRFMRHVRTQSPSA